MISDTTQPNETETTIEAQSISVTTVEESPTEQSGETDSHSLERPELTFKMMRKRSQIYRESAREVADSAMKLLDCFGSDVPARHTLRHAIMLAIVAEHFHWSVKVPKFRASEISRSLFVKKRIDIQTLLLLNKIDENPAEVAWAEMEGVFDMLLNMSKPMYQRADRNYSPKPRPVSRFLG